MSTRRFPPPMAPVDVERPRPTFPDLLPRVTSGLNLTENRRFEFAVAAAAGAVD
jgi:hypothetical protein